MRYFDLGCGGLPGPRDSFILWLVGPSGPRVSFPTSAVVGGARGSSGFIPDFGRCRWGPRVLGFHSRLPFVVGGAHGSSGFIPDFGRRWWGPRVFSHFPFFLLVVL